MHATMVSPVVEEAVAPGGNEGKGPGVSRECRILFELETRTNDGPGRANVPDVARDSDCVREALLLADVEGAADTDDGDVEDDA